MWQKMQQKACNMDNDINAMDGKNLDSDMEKDATESTDRDNNMAKDNIHGIA